MAPLVAVLTREPLTCPWLRRRLAAQYPVTGSERPPLRTGVGRSHEIQQRLTANGYPQGPEEWSLMPRTPRFTARSLIAISMLGMVLLGGGIYFGVNYAVERAVVVDAQDKAQRWTEYFLTA